MIDVRVGDAPFDAGDEIDRLVVADVGAVASFVGVVRGGGGLVSLTLDHYPAMTVAALKVLCQEAVDRWSLSATTIVHRVGTMHPGERIVFVGTASQHRAAALDACAFLIDRLKTGAPFWKRETFEGDQSSWVEARTSDNDAASRWS